MNILYFSNNISDFNNERLKNIYYNIQSLLNYSPLYENKTHLGIWRIYLFLAICIFSEPNKINQIKNLEIIFNFTQK